MFQVGLLLQVHITIECYHNHCHTTNWCFLNRFAISLQMYMCVYYDLILSRTPTTLRFVKKDYKMGLSWLVLLFILIQLSSTFIEINYGLIGEWHKQCNFNNIRSIAYCAYLGYTLRNQVQRCIKTRGLISFKPQGLINNLVIL